jgi:nucleoside-diphosphate-sugar epimerase
MPTMSQTILVAGAAGFVGSAVVRACVQALQNNEELCFSDGTSVTHVAALVRPGSSLERLGELRESASWSIEYANLANRRELRTVLEKVRPRTILHVALDRRSYLEVPQEGLGPLVVEWLETLFEGLSGVKGARFIHTGSAWVLAPGTGLDEQARIGPRTPYAENKFREDLMLPTLGERTGVPWINLRLFNTFGKYENPSRLLPYLLARLAAGETADLSHGEQVRDFNDVDLVARAYLLALRAPDSACGAVYHIGSGRGATMREFAMAAAAILGRADLIRFGAATTQDQDMSCLVADPRLAQLVLNWAPETDLEKLIRRTARWWLDRWKTMDELNPAAGFPMARAY